ncbi:aspartate/glutamate racemase family protein [Flagellimonas sp. S174]|uniref:aspartate/glutamate racemase family protein n=1 Tax=Flagellimonas sp. S174 TaxID=3410790 RepID=UPI003BF5F805
MKTIGIIGGMSWESSKFYYEYINRIVADQLGGSHSAKILMSSVDFSDIEKLSFEDNWDKIGELMAQEAKRLESAGADSIILATNTIHLVAEYIEEAISVPFLHIAKATGDAIKKKSISKIGLLGTRFTMERDFYTKILTNDFGLEVLIPSEEERTYLQNLIYGELVKGQFTSEAKEKCLAIIEGLKSKGAQGVILGCTELPILIPEKEVTLPSFDTTMIHSLAAVDFATS